jgi:hypothetical protein
VDPRAVLDAVVKRNIPTPRRETNPRILIVQPIANYIVTDVSLLHSTQDDNLISQMSVYVTFRPTACEKAPSAYEIMHSVIKTLRKDSSKRVAGSQK